MQERYVEFLRSDFEEDVQDRIEKISILLLAADFIGSKEVEGAKNLVQISKIAVPIFLDEFKTGEVICVNGVKNKRVTIKSLTLRPRSEFEQLLSSDLPYREKYNKLLALLKQPQVKQVSVKGLAGGLMVNELPRLVANSSDSLGDFVKIQGPVTQEDFQATVEELKRNFVGVNEIRTLAEGYINDLIQQIEQAIRQTETDITTTEEEYTRKLENKRKEIANKKKQLDADLVKIKKNIDAKAKRDIEALYDELRSKVAANLKKDATQVQKKIDELIRVAETVKDKDELLDRFSRLLTDISIDLDSMKSAAVHSKELVTRTRSREANILTQAENEKKQKEGDTEYQKRVAEDEINPILDEKSKRITELEQKREDLRALLDQIKDEKRAVLDEVETSIRQQREFTIKKEELSDIPIPITLWVKMYVFRYQKGGKDIFLFIPPLVLPDSMKQAKKLPFGGKHRTVGFYLLSKGMTNYLSEFAKEASKNLDFKERLRNLPNIIASREEVRAIYFDNQRLLINNLEVKQKDLEKATGRLTQIFAGTG